MNIDKNYIHQFVKISNFIKQKTPPVEVGFKIFIDINF